VQGAFEEDVGSGDITTDAVVPENLRAEGAMVAREQLVVAGVRLAEIALGWFSEQVQCTRCAEDGRLIEPGEPILQVAGPARAILTAERVALNFVQRLSGVATATRAFVNAVEGTKARILDTRKTTPGWRRFEKYAVVCGGGRNHRFGLFDMILIKDNHLAALGQEHGNPIVSAIRQVRFRHPTMTVEIEADTLEQVDDAVRAGAEIILLDNMTLKQMREAVRLVAGRATLEASGGVTLKTVRAIARTGVDYISVGAITHSARAVDIALDFRT